MIEFLLNGKTQTVASVDPNTTLLNYLRMTVGLVGTKEGCGSGDCGACTVLVGEWQAEGWQYKAINSCLALLASVHGRQVITVEALASDTDLHPVQQAMVDSNGSQCGYCTPGFVMSLAGLYRKSGDVSRHDILQAVSGNLCRCTGYAPIVSAAQTACADRRELALGEVAFWAPEAGLVSVGQDPDEQVYVPQNEAELKRLLGRMPNATLVAGGTDINLKITQQLASLGTIVVLAQVAELRQIDSSDTGLCLGAAVTYADAAVAIGTLYPSAAELMSRIGSLQIRQAATLAGNIANASPIGDGPPLLIALNASIEVAGVEGNYRCAVDEFITGYKTTLLKPGEYIRAIYIPAPKAAARYRFDKVSKRYEDDISTVLLASRICVSDGLVSDICMVFGGMAATPKRATALEQAVLGVAVTELEPTALSRLLEDDFAPMTDVRASADYRMAVAQSLAYKALIALSSGDEPIGIWSAALAEGA